MFRKYPEEYYLFFEKFNEGEYYECHDLLEEIWLTDRQNKFLQGLLQVAVAVYHFENGNIYGSRALFQSAYQYLQPYRPEYWDLDLEPVINFIEKALAVLPQERRISIDEVTKIDFPKIQLHLKQEKL
ncbi:DUF309 domain-containing protein [Tepidibacillus fermentans]|uniref:DUF309 domain-containing protein n=1 Tax=Tepidibacillus fermentans TaxID=1281767 RepID=A0A4R3KIU1_9BACI|nr:DUF309 domain-containing protein [Tepidibacillus fermentans]TCS83132.1 hypothetical protein EDD72_10658 [Tepidibacillus fermentans]